MFAKNLIATVAVASSFGFAISAFAAPVPSGPVVSLQFAGGGGTPTSPASPYNAINNSADTAGLVSESHWNYQVDGSQDQTGNFVSTLSFTGNGTIGSGNATLVDSTGANTALSYTYAYTRVSDTGNHNNNFTGADAQLTAEAAGVQNNGNAILTVNGLSGTYSIIAYVSPFFFGGDNITEHVGLVGGSSYYLTSSTTLGTYVQGTATTAGDAVQSNYVEFDNLSGPTQSLTVFDTGNFYGLDGIQIITTAAASPIPEPASLGIISAGSLLLLRRRRTA